MLVIDLYKKWNASEKKLNLERVFKAGKVKYKVNKKESAKKEKKKKRGRDILDNGPSQRVVIVCERVVGGWTTEATAAGPVSIPHVCNGTRTAPYGYMCTHAHARTYAHALTERDPRVRR